MNHTDLVDFIEDYTDGDKIYKTEVGSAELEFVNAEEMETLKQQYNVRMQEIEDDWKDNIETFD